MTPHQRRVRRMLAHHGIDAWIEANGKSKHRKICFEQDGSTQRVPIASTPSDPNAALRAVRDIVKRFDRREEKTTVDDDPTLEAKSSVVTDQPAEIPNGPMTTCSGSVACYRATSMVEFRFSHELAAAVPSDGYDVEYNRSDNTFWILPGGRMRLHRQGRSPDSVRLRIGHRAIGLGFFGAVSADYLAADGKILVHPIAQLPLLKERVVVEEVKELKFSPHKYDDETLHDILEQVRRAEAETLMRLVRRADGRLVFAREVE